MTPALQTPAPDFELRNQYGEHVRLSGFRGGTAVVLVFFPLAFSVVCTSELDALRDHADLFEQAGAEVVGVSVDSTATLRAFAEQEGYRFSLLSDFWPHGAIAREYGVLLETRGYAGRATFVIDPLGTIRASFMTAPGEPRTIDQYRAALAALTGP